MKEANARISLLVFRPFLEIPQAFTGVVGASIPILTVLGPIRTIVTVTLSPIKIFSPGFRESTNISSTPL